MSWAGRTVVHRGGQVPFVGGCALIILARRQGRCLEGVAGGDGEECVGEGGVPVPGAVLADLAVVQARLADPKVANLVILAESRRSRAA